MLEPFTTATANRSTVLPCSAFRISVSPACGVHTLFAVNLCGRGQFAIDLLAHLEFKRMVSCSFRDKRMRLKTRAYGLILIVALSCDFSAPMHIGTCLCRCHNQGNGKQKHESCWYDDIVLLLN